MMTHLEMQAVRAFDRIIAQTTAGWDEMESADAHWDAGEWSGPAWAKNWTDEIDRVVKLVAFRFGLWEKDLNAAIEQRCYDQFNAERAALEAHHE